MVNKESRLLKLYESKGLTDKNEFIIYKEYCNDFILSCLDNDLAIIGIEGFYILPDKGIRPNLDEIADFSGIDAVNWDVYLKECTKASQVFIGHMLNGGKSDCYCFELVGFKA